MSEIQNIDQINLKPDCSILLSGSRRSGKSVLSTNLIYRLTNEYEYHSIILISETGKLDNNGSYNNIVSDNMVFPTEKMDEVLSKVIKYQTENKKRNKSKRIMVILDDLNLRQKSKGPLQKLFSLGRHLNLCIILSVQFPKIVCDNIIRSNIDILFCSKMNMAGIEAIYQMINTPMKISKFYDYVQQNTKNHQFVMYNLFNDEPSLQTVKAELIEISTNKV